MEGYSLFLEMRWMIGLTTRMKKTIQSWRAMGTNVACMERKWLPS